VNLKGFRYIARGIKYKFLSAGYSESGEDLIASYLLGNIVGSYVDVGAGHPVVGSNTYKLYRKGWSGIAVDGNKKLETSWKVLRPRDKFMPILVGPIKDFVDFYQYENELRSTANVNVKNLYTNENRKHVSKKVTQETLNTLFEENVLTNKPVFLSLDIEGSEYQALSTFNFDRFAPKLIAIESWNLPWVIKSRSHELIQSNGYRLTAYSGLTAFYMSESDLNEIIDSRPQFSE
jgi:hypothetical protein